MSIENENTSVAVDKSYYREGAAWENDIHRSLRRSRNLAWIVSASAVGIASVAVLSNLMLFPLKQYEPYMVLVDKTTGYTEIARALKPGALASDEAVTTANIVRYIRARETYDPRQIKTNFDLAQLLSTGLASADLVKEFTPSNPDAKDKKYGTETIINTEIKSVSFLNKNTATVRFMTTEKRQNSEKRSHWVAVVKFRYTNTPLKNEYRFDNPLGFQVTEFRKDQESIQEAPTPDRVIR